MIWNRILPQADNIALRSSVGRNIGKPAQACQKTTNRNYSSSKLSMVKGKLSSAGGSVEGVWYTSKGARPISLDMGRYGLKRINYAKLEPPVWTLPPHPPTKSITERIIFPLTLVATASVVLWAYMNPEEDDMKEYWKRVETGQILVEDDDEDEDFDDEEED